MAPDPADFEARPPQSSRGDIAWGGGSRGVGRGAEGAVLTRFRAVAKNLAGGGGSEGGRPPSK